MMLPKSMIPASRPCRKAPEIAGCGSSIPTGDLLDFFPVKPRQFLAGTGRKSSGNDRKISGGNTTSGMERDFAGSHRFLPYVFDMGNDAGTTNSQYCTLIATGRDSTKALVVADLGITGQDHYDVSKLKGKILDV